MQSTEGDTEEELISITLREIFAWVAFLSGEEWLSHLTLKCKRAGLL